MLDQELDYRKLPHGNALPYRLLSYPPKSAVLTVEEELARGIERLEAGQSS